MIIYEEGEQFNVPPKWLSDHDKQVRDEVIEMYHAKLYSMLLRMPWVKRLTNKEVMELNDKVAEKMKGEQNE